MFKSIWEFLSTKFYLTKGQVITQGMLYQMEKENAGLKLTIRGYKGSFTRQDRKCASCEYRYANVAKGGMA